MAEKKSVLTLNLGSQRVGMARFALGAKGALQLNDYATREMPGDPTTDGTRRLALASPVKELAGQFKGTGQPVSYAVPGQFLIAKFVKLPPLAEDQVDKIVGFEAQQAVPFPLSETVWDYQLMGGSAPGELEVGIVAIRTEHLEDLHHPVEAAGLETKLVDAAPAALYNAFRYNYPDAQGCSLLIDLGARSTNLLFIEGNRLFISSFQIGGASITQAIAREMGMDFDTAEGRKVNSGFVHLGSNYADHEDPEIDAMSKVIRNALLRVHGEITRRTNAYRSQQGGSAPATVYLAGAGASLPYLKEVFEEKLRVPVEYFNALRNVQVGPKVNPEKAAAEAHTLGELVGLALRELSSPMELDLSPASVKEAKDVSSRKPNLIAAAACLFAGLAALWGHNVSAAGKYDAEAAKLQREVDKLAKYDQQIKEQEARQAKEETRAQVLQNVISDRQYWVNLFNALNAQFTDENIWFTQISPVTATGEAVTAPAGFGNAYENPFLEGLGPSKSAANRNAPQTAKVTALHITGINRGAGPEVPELLLRIKNDEAMKSYFDFGEMSDEEVITTLLRNNAGDQSLKDGYNFQMKLPLKRKFDVVKQDGAGSGR